MEVLSMVTVVPCGIPVVTLFCFNFIGDGLRDAPRPEKIVMSAAGERN